MKGRNFCGKVIAHVLLALALAVLPAAAVNATPAGVPTFLAGVRVSQSTFYEPYPVEPGEAFDLWVCVENSATASYSTVAGVECELVGKYPFSSADPAESLARDVGALGPTQIALLKFRLRVDEKAVSGRNDLPLRCKSAGSDWASVDLVVFVQARDPVLSIEAVESAPKEFSPGGSGVLEFTLENKASAVLRNVVLKLDLSSPSLPLSPENSSGDAYLERVLGGEKGRVSFNLLASPSAQAGVYKIPVSLSYRDELGTKYARNSTVSVVVYSAPDVLVSVDRSDVLKTGSKGRAFVAITNKGLSQVKRLVLTAGEGEGYRLLSAPTAYLGDIDGDDFETVELELFVSSPGGELRVPLTYSFRDEFNKPYEKTESVAVRVYSQAEVTALQLEQATGGLNNVIIGAIVLAIVFLAYRWYSKRKR